MDNQNTPRVYSADYYWKKHGYTVQTLPRRGSGGHRRVIRDPRGTVVLDGVGKGLELNWIHEHLEPRR